MLVKKQNLMKFIQSIIFSFLLLAICFPFVWIIITSFKEAVDIMSPQFLFTPTLSNYIDLFFSRSSHFPQYLLNSTIVAISTTVIIISIAGLAAYGISRSEFMWHIDKMVLGLVLFLRMIFPVAFALPFYKMLEY